VRRSGPIALAFALRASARSRCGCRTCDRRPSPVRHTGSRSPWATVLTPRTIRRSSTRSRPGMPNEAR